MNGPDSFAKCVTIGNMERSVAEFSKNFPDVVVFGFDAFLIALITVSYTHLTLPTILLV